MLKAITVTLAIVSIASASLIGGTCVRFPDLFNTTIGLATDSIVAANETYIESFNATFPAKQALLMQASYLYGSAALQLKQADNLLTYCGRECPVVPEPRVLCPCDYSAYNATIAAIDSNVAEAAAYEAIVLDPATSCEECKAYAALLHENYVQNMADLNALADSLRACALGRRGGRIF